MNRDQEEFLRDEFFSLTLMATVQRANVYRPSAPDGEKGAFQAALRDQLQGLEPIYREPVVEEDHIQNILTLADRTSTDHGGVLMAARFRIGTAQKALNLYLKYLWCMGILPAPPHCPFDYRVISKLRGCREIRWTALDTATAYRKLVTAAKVEAGGMSLAEWELKTYNAAFNTIGIPIIRQV
jgi:hypothetical protein